MANFCIGATQCVRLHEASTPRWGARVAVPDIMICKISSQMLLEGSGCDGQVALGQRTPIYGMIGEKNQGARPRDANL